MSSRLTRVHLKVLTAIERCRTAALGGHRDRCGRCGYETTSYSFNRQPLRNSEAQDSLDVLSALLGQSQEGRKHIVEHAGGLALRLDHWKYRAAARAETKCHYRHRVGQ